MKREVADNKIRRSNFFPRVDAEKIIAALLCFVLVLGCVPLSATAGDDMLDEITLASFAPIDPISVAFGTPNEELQLPETVSATSASGTAKNIPVTKWNSQRPYDANSAGSYTYVADITSLMADGVTPPTVTVNVQPSPSASDTGAKENSSDKGASNGGDEAPLLLGGPLLGSDGGVNIGTQCKLTPNKTNYLPGEIMNFAIATQYADPGTASSLTTVTIGIPLPTTHPAIQLPNFNRLGTEGDYAGVPMYSLSFQGNTVDFYDVTTSEGIRRIEYTLHAGDTIQGILPLLLPNGVTESNQTITLEPAIISLGNYENVTMTPGTATVTADFGWNDVTKTGSADSIGTTSLSTWDMDRITYTIAANSASSGLATGRIFTDHYELDDSLVLNDLYYADGVLTSSESGGISSFFVDGLKVLEVDKPLAGLTVNKVLSEGNIVGFSLKYRAINTTLGNNSGGALELPNLAVNASLFLEGMHMSAGGESASVVNTADFKAYSPYYDIASGKIGSEYYHESTAEYTSYVRGNCTITKEAFKDAACTDPMPMNYDGTPASFYYKLVATNLGSASNIFSIEDVLPAGLIYANSYTTDPASPAPSFSQNGNRIRWSGINIPSGDSYTVVVKVSFDMTALGGNVNMLNVANLYNASGALMANDDVTIRYLAGEVTDAAIQFEKSSDKNYGGVGDPLTYTIKATNTSSTAKLTTIVDNWPGDKIYPTRVTGCEYFTLLDGAGTEYTLEQVAANTSIIIEKIKFYNIFLPAKGSKSVTVTGIITNAFDELVNTVGNGAAGTLTTKAYGVSLQKEAYTYSDTTGVGEKITNLDVVNPNDTVCYKLTAKNFKSSAATLSLIDLLPSGLTLVNGSVNGANGQIIIQRGSTYSNLGWADASTYTTNEFTLATGETVYLYLLANVGQSAVDASFSNGNKITNAAYLEFSSGIKTGTATADIFTYVDKSISASIIKKSIMAANYNDDLTFKDAGFLVPDYSSTPYPVGGVCWLGSYMGYCATLHATQAVAGSSSMPVYEVLDILPPGMEFVGVAMNGEPGFFNWNGTTLSYPDLQGKLIGNGESGAWSSGNTSGNINCDYDPATRQLHITFGERGNESPLMVPVSTAGKTYNTYFNIFVRVTDLRPKYSNVIKAKVDMDVALEMDKNGIPIGTTSIDDDKRYVEDFHDSGLINMTPGLEKKLLGHYAGSAALNTNNTVINPGESLRFALYIKNQDNSSEDNIYWPVPRAYVTDFVVTDILPAEYVYQRGSAKLTLNTAFRTDPKVTSAPNNSKEKDFGLFEPTVEQLSDGRTKLTWTFSGDSMRLFDERIGDKTGFMHTITYDTDWNTDYIETYGSYTNTATVTHSYDFSSVSTGSPDFNANSISSSAVVNVYGSAGSAAVKSVSAHGDTAYGNQPANGQNVLVIAQGEPVTYSLTIKNSASKSTMQNLVIIDELPRVNNDTGVVNRISRGSEFDVLFGATPNVSAYLTGKDGLTAPINTSLYTVEYGMSAGGLNSAGDWTYKGTGGRIAWGTASAGKNAIRIAFDPSFSFDENCSVTVYFTAETPTNAEVGTIAWNSFGYTYQSDNPTNGLSERIYAEPEKVGVQMPGAKLSIAKNVNGDPAPTAAEFTFVLKNNDVVMPHVRYRLNGEYTPYYTAQDGSFKLKAGDTAVLNVPPGPGYTYTMLETDMPANFTLSSILPSAAQDGTVAGSTFTFKNDLAQNETVGAIFINTYSTPPTIDVTVNKVWVGDTAADRPSGVNVQLYEQSTASSTPVASGQPVTLTSAGGWSHTWTGLASGSIWTVREVSALPAGYNSDVTGDQINGYTITNTYTVPMGSLTVSKTVTGTGADQEKLFNFNFTFSGNAAYAYYGSKNGVIVSGGSIQLKHGESVTISIPKDVVYSVVEEAVQNYTPTPANRVISGVIGLTCQTAAFTNAYVPPQPPETPVDPPESTGTGNLSVKKTVTGSDSDPTKDFVFTITFDAPGAYDFTGSKSGKISSGNRISLHHGQVITILGLPAGTTYTVTESNKTGYRESSTSASGVIIANEGVTAAFVNNRGGTIPKTGSDNEMLYGALIMAVSALCMALDAVVYAKRRARRRK